MKDNPDAMEVSRLANSLYYNEHLHKIGDDWTVDDNLKWRQEYVPPILRALKSKLKEIRNNGINFFDYLSDVLNKSTALPPGSGVEAYRNLLPDKWKKNEQGQ